QNKSFRSSCASTDFNQRQKRKVNPAGCGLNRGHRQEYGGALWPPLQDNGLPATEKLGSRSNNFLFAVVMTAQKYLNSRAMAAHSMWPIRGETSRSHLSLWQVTAHKPHRTLGTVLYLSGEEGGWLIFISFIYFILIPPMLITY
ncbi:hypothetical protein P3383_23330, partial [Vibrio parahaemolyticus]|nr:hypothetical protein [Vibrio parahaemolyticus]